MPHLSLHKIVGANDLVGFDEGDAVGADDGFRLGEEDGELVGVAEGDAIGTDFLQKIKINKT